MISRLHKAPWGRRTIPPRPIYTNNLHSMEGCRFIVSDETHPAQYCNQPRKPGSSYCEAHHKLTHHPAPPLSHRHRFSDR